MGYMFRVDLDQAMFVSQALAQEMVVLGTQWVHPTVEIATANVRWLRVCACYVTVCSRGTGCNSSAHCFRSRHEQRANASAYMMAYLFKQD